MQGRPRETVALFAVFFFTFSPFPILFYRNFTINMGTSKITNYSAAEIRLANIAKALSHPARIAILKLLLQKQSCVCGDLVDELPLAQSTVSQHLKELKAAGLIQGEIEGTKVCYCIDPQVWQEARESLSAFLQPTENLSKSCC